MPPAISLPPQIHSVWAAALVTLAFALLARALQGVSFSGAVAGGIVCFGLYSMAGPAAFGLLALVFLLTWLATRIGYQRKLRLGTAEKKGGRTAAQVFANVGVAAGCAIGYAVTHKNPFLLAMSASLSEAAADTVSSELGQAFGRTARLITSWKRVPAGTDGGVSLAGTLAGVGAALVVSLAGVFTGLFTPQESLWSFVAAVLGMMCDSYLGATLESRKVLNNNSVNLIGTLSSALVILVTQPGFWAK